MTCSLLPFAGTRGVCDRCGTALTGRKTRWCTTACMNEWNRNHIWGWASRAARRRDGQRCVRPDCPTPTTSLEVNHIVPRNGAGYGFDCAHHLDGLETLCHPHHVEVTREQRRARMGVT